MKHSGIWAQRFGFFYFFNSFLRIKVWLNYFIYYFLCTFATVNSIIINILL